jgi:hypothetical protein
VAMSRTFGSRRSREGRTACDRRLWFTGKC